MIILHIAPIRWTRPTGPAVSVPSLVNAQNAFDGVEAAFINSLDSVDEEDTRREPSYPVFRLRNLRATRRRLDLPAPFAEPDLVVFHSTYIPAHARVARQLRHLGIPYVICPRGGMTRLAVKRKGWKKRIGNLLFFHQLVAGSEGLHCLTVREAAESADWKRPMFVVPNGIEIPAEIRRRPPSTSLRMVFIGRLAIRHKGLDLLVRAAALARDHLKRCDAAIDLYGPDHEGGAKKLDDLIQSAGLNGLVRRRGLVTGEAKRAVLRQASVFLHTSRWEGLPMSVLEAMASGIPCLLTPGTNMAEEIRASHAGWAVNQSAGAIADGLRTVLDASAQNICQAGMNARRLAQSKYSWDTIASQTVEAYRKFAVPTLQPWLRSG
jgi:glycosyltransferase involved in cell wall biosynthesis